jgi:hypothetical protein
MVQALVGWLTRLGLGRGLSVGVVVTMLFATLGAAAWVVTTEVAAALARPAGACRDGVGRGGPGRRAERRLPGVAAHPDQEVARPSISSSIVASTGFVTCRSKPAASARRRSSAWP